MNKITQSDIELLTETSKSPVLTLYLPTHKITTPATVTEDKARYKHIISQGLAQWEVAGGVISKHVREQLEVTGDDTDFWNETSKGLAIFADQDMVRMFHLPMECDEYIYVSHSFDIAPLQVVLSQDQPFYLLVLAKHDPKLFYGDSYALESLDIDFPSSPEDALNIDEMYSGSNTIRGMATSTGGNDMLSTHGQGDSNHAGQEEHLKYLRIIDNKLLKSIIIDTHLPLLVAATDSEVSDFKRISNYPNILNGSVQGNHTMTPTQYLHDLAWPIVSEAVVGSRAVQLVDRFNEDKGRQKASSDITEIHEAISAGRVHTVLLGIIERTNDSVSDATSKTPALLMRFQNGYLTHKLYELARSVVAQGGAIVGINPDLLATPTKVAALFRY